MRRVPVTLASARGVARPVFSTDRDVAAHIAGRTDKGLRRFTWHQLVPELQQVEIAQPGVAGAEAYTAALQLLARVKIGPDKLMGHALWLAKQLEALDGGAPPEAVAYLFMTLGNAAAKSVTVEGRCPAHNAMDKMWRLVIAAETTAAMHGDAPPFTEEQVLMLLEAARGHRALFDAVVCRAVQEWKMVLPSEAYALSIAVTVESSDAALAAYARLRAAKPAVAAAPSVVEAVVEACLEHRDPQGALDVLSVATALHPLPSATWERLLSVSKQISPEHVEKTYATMLAFGVTPSVKALFTCFHAYTEACTKRHDKLYAAAIQKAKEILALKRVAPSGAYIKTLEKLFKKTGQSRADLAAWIEAHQTAGEDCPWLGGWMRHVPPPARAPRAAPFPRPITPPPPPPAAAAAGA
eukprot:TRINITY_DN1921_c1_g2_i1.p1 TRINITY_DN1921_c1_g2~~TRINITY_DN1921_c1_g2_i1.p1  ORF type:complete len:411 (+),score=115.28 TRINITY_DN1921_c1_g2_i1:55-1287(+)